MRAPAKINLTLHIKGRRADGMHELESLVAFAGFGDSLGLRDDEGLDLFITGPTGHLVDVEHNLVLKAAHALAHEVPGLHLGAFDLLKRLPVAAGIGGGSADAAAALRLLAQRNGLSLSDTRVIAAARNSGSDVPVCLQPQARMMRGTGDVLGDRISLPPLFAVLVNPGIPLATRDVFARIGLAPGQSHGFGPHPEIDARTTETLLRGLARARNDMEDAACVLAPSIGHVLSVLMAARGCRLARMSGSGATCFGLFENCHQAAAAARVIRRDHPEWWVKSSVLR